MAGPIRQTPIICNGHTRPVVDLQFADDPQSGPLLITSSKDGQAMLRAGDTGDWIGTFVGHSGAVWCCALNNNATLAATGAADFCVKIWDVDFGVEKYSISENHIVRSIDLSKTDNGAYLLVSNNKKQLNVYDLKAADKPLISMPGHEDIIRRCLWTKDDKCMLTICDSKNIRIWDKACGDKPVWQVTVSDRPMDAQIWIGDKAVDAVVAAGKQVHRYSLDFRKNAFNLAMSYTLPAPVYSAGLNSKGDMLVCGCEDSLLHRIDANSGESLETCRGHFGPVHCVRFSPDGRLFASGSEDGTVRLWQTRVGEEYGLWRRSDPTAVAAE